MTTQVVEYKPVEIQTYGSRDQIKEMADRLRKLMPGTTNMNEAEALTVAQIAIAHGLDPFNGEVWGLKGENGKWYGTMIGIKGLRKAAHRASDAEGGVFWIEQPVRVDPKKYNQADNAIVYEIHLRDTVTMQAYGKSVNVLTTAGVPYKEAIEMIGKAPVWIGVGIATPDERSKMGIHQRARKRAEADAYKQRYDVQFMGATYTEAAEDIPTDANIPVIENGHFVPEVTQEIDKPRHSEDEIMSDLGFETDEAKMTELPQDSGAQVRVALADVLVEEGIFENTFSAKAIVGRLELEKVTQEVALKMARGYRGWRDFGANTDQAVKNIQKGEYPK